MNNNHITRFTACSLWAEGEQPAACGWRGAACSLWAEGEQSAVCGRRGSRLQSEEKAPAGCGRRGASAVCGRRRGSSLQSVGGGGAACMRPPTNPRDYQRSRKENVQNGSRILRGKCRLMEGGSEKAHLCESSLLFCGAGQTLPSLSKVYLGFNVLSFP